MREVGRCEVGWRHIRTEGVCAMAERAGTEIAYLPPAVPPANHGHTVAAWFAMTAVMFGAVVAGLGVALPEIWLAVVGGVIVVVGLLGGLLLRAMGFGQRDVSR